MYGLFRCAQCGQPGTRQRPLFKAACSFQAWHQDCEPEIIVQFDEMAYEELMRLENLMKDALLRSIAPPWIREL